MKPSIEHLGLEEQLIVCSWFYKLGNPLISDQKFNNLFSRLKEQNPNSFLVLKTWSELEEPTELLQSSNYYILSENLKKQNQLNSNTVNDSVYFLPIENMKLRTKHLKETKEYFNQFIPKSIDSIESETASEEWLKELLGKDESIELSFSLKIDGWYSDVLYYKGYYIGAFTRGRADGDQRDISIAMSYVMPMKIDTDELYVAIAVEAAMNKSSLEILKKKDPSRNWKSPRNSMSTLLMNSLTEDYYRFIIPYGHGVKGIFFDTAEEMYSFMQQQGITSTHNVTITVSKTSEIINLIQYIGSMALDIPSDGIVARVNQTSQYMSYDTIGKYDTAIRAYRLFEWQSDIFISVVTGIGTSDNAKYTSLNLQIMPVTISNNQTITKLDADNLDRILRSEIKVGDLVAFHLRSHAYVDWLDYSTRYIKKCAEYQIPMDVKFVKAIEKFKHSLAETMDFDVEGAIEYINQNRLETTENDNEC